MTEPSQYFKGRTVQEQMNEVIGYVDARAEEVAAAKADDVLEPAEQAKDDAIAAKEAAESARDTTLAALPQIQQDITDLKAEDVALDGRLDNVELRITTAEGNIVTIQGRVTAVETKNSQQDSAITALQVADTNNVKITGEHAIGNYAVLLTDSQLIYGIKTFLGELIRQGENSPAIYIDNLSIERSERPESTQQCWIKCRDKNFDTFGMIQFVMLENGHRVCQVTMFDKNGGQHVKNILTIDEDGNVIA